MTIADITVEKTSRIMRKAYPSRGIPVISNIERALGGLRHARIVTSRRSG